MKLEMLINEVRSENRIDIDQLILDVKSKYNEVMRENIN